MGVIWGSGVFLSGLTDGRSLVVMALLGLIALLNGWCMLTNWGGICEKSVEHEHRHHEATGQLPLGQTKAGRAVRDQPSATPRR